jgi:hypothetical protein
MVRAGIALLGSDRSLMTKRLALPRQIISAGARLVRMFPANLHADLLMMTGPAN